MPDWDSNPSQIFTSLNLTANAVQITFAIMNNIFEKDKFLLSTDMAHCVTDKHS